MSWLFMNNHEEVIGMYWKGRRQSNNVEDRRGTATKGVIGGGIGTIIVILLFALLGGNPSDILEQIQIPNSEYASNYQETEEEKELAEFVAVVLAETEDVWTAIFRQNGKEYSLPRLVLYSGYANSACGTAGASTGPFYCPGDYRVYIDLSFFNELQHRFQAPGDFAMAYVIAHEIGHHIQNQLGISDEVMSYRNRLSQKEFNQLMVRLELQADYLAGVWAHYVNRMDLLDEHDVQEALNAASAVGDDRIQKSTQGYVVPDSFTHGTSEQRKRWFYKGFKSGNLKDGDTFNTDVL